MICEFPYMAGNVPFGCGRCLPCRINRRSLWSWRMYLESLCHERCSFATLTYSDDNYPSGGNLQPGDTRNWLKRLRKAKQPERIRYFLVGEYGDDTWRPHYHVALFGVGPESAELVDRTWQLGFTYLAEFNQKTAQYIAGYVTKKMTSVDDPRLKGLHPEFARMSNRPGIGADAMKVIAQNLEKYRSSDGDVPYMLKMGKNKTIPLGRYLRRKLREEIGMSKSQEEWFKEAFLLERSSEVRDLLKAALAEDSTAPHTSKSVVVNSTKGRRANLEGRYKARNPKRKI